AHVFCNVPQKLICHSPDIDVRKKALDIAMEMVSSKNVEEVVVLLKKELTKTLDQNYEKVRKLFNQTSYQLTVYRITSTVNFSFKPFIHVQSTFPKSQPA